jgi:hypothetical protein
MLLHLPIAILTTLSPIPISDTVPKFDIAKECHFEGGSSAIFDRCSHDEAEALQQLEAEWPQFSGVNKGACLAETTVAGFKSYVELIICLEMARDVSPKANRGDPLESQSTHAASPEISVVDKRD